MIGWGHLPWPAPCNTGQCPRSAGGAEMLRGLSVWCLLGAPLVAVGCTGTISEDATGNQGPGGSSMDPGKGPKPPTGPESKPGAGSLSDKDTVPGAAPIRRLTKLEYDNTIRDLLGVGSVTADFT